MVTAVYPGRWVQIRRLIPWLLAPSGMLWATAPATAGDMSIIPLYDAERTGRLGEPQFLNNWGGPFSAGNILAVARDAGVAHSGLASLRVDLGTITAGNFGFFQAFSSGFAAENTRQTRDLTRYESFESFVRNDTGVALNLKVEFKDYRDSGAHLATYAFPIAANSTWTKISAPLNLNAPGWQVVGSPDLSRTFITSFVVTPTSAAVSGSIFLDDFSLREIRPAIDTNTAPIPALAERLAERQFSGLWTARNRSTGLIYNTSDNSQLAAMNTTAGVLWMLPSAVRRGWVSQADADAFAGQVAGSLNANLNASTFVPTRFAIAATAARPGGPNEESSIDASFMALAMHNYKTQPATSAALAASIDAVQNRFRLDAFAIPKGFRLAYFPATGFTAGTYDGYTHEGKVISLAASASDAHHLPLDEYWNSDTFRSRVFLVDPDDAHLTHSFSEFRAPFEQALLNLFADTSDRGVDNYPDRALAANPWQNYLRYERETAAKLAQLGRDDFIQPDAGNGGASGYQQYSLYNNFGQDDLFMPWSVSLALLAGAPGAEDALRTLLSSEILSGPLGLADTARWATGAAGPTDVPASQDNWNVVLSTMALLEYLDGETSASARFAALPEIAAALDLVFVDGDLDGNGFTGGDDLAIWRSGFPTAAGATPAGGDSDGDGDVDGADFLRWQRGLGGVQPASPTATPVPEPAALVPVALVLMIAASVRRERRRRGKAKARQRELPTH